MQKVIKAMDMKVTPHTASTFEKKMRIRTGRLGKAYFGIVRCGESRIDRHPRAQKAYAPWASNPGDADTPPSYVWPREQDKYRQMPRNKSTWTE